MIRNALQRLMYGRYGYDQLSIFLLVLYAVLEVLSLVTRWAALSWLAMAAIILTLIRAMSRNFENRRAENAKFMKLAGPFLNWLRMRRTISRDKEHIYFKCPSCGQYLRVPRGKGKINVTCRSCGASFQEKS